MKQLDDGRCLKLKVFGQRDFGRLKEVWKYFTSAREPHKKHGNCLLYLLFHVWFQCRFSLRLSACKQRYKLLFSGVCTVYAFLTRKCPDGFNETKHIGFTNYTAIVIWLAFVPLYIASTNNSIRMVTLAMSLSLR